MRKEKRKMPGFSYITIATTGQQHRDQLIARTRQFLKKMDELAKEGNEGAKQAEAHALTIRNGWVDIGGGRTFTYSELDPADARSYNPWYETYAWNDIATVEVIPVITVRHLMEDLLEKYNPLKG